MRVAAHARVAAGHGKTQFRARLSRRDAQPRQTQLTWKTSLLTLAGGQTWWLRITTPARVDTAQLGALVRLARRLTKKKGQLQVVTHRGHPTTAKSLGTRMGNGKGKVVNYRRWWTPGFNFLRVVSSTRPGWLAALNSRCGASLTVCSGGY